VAVVAYLRIRLVTAKTADVYLNMNFDEIPVLVNVAATVAM